MIMTITANIFHVLDTVQAGWGTEMGSGGRISAQL